MKLVRQLHENGCGPACIAMILDINYKYAVEKFINDFSIKGINHLHLLKILMEEGYAVIEKYGKVQPFAPIHLCQIILNSSKRHFVIMSEDGLILDPLFDETQKLNNYTVEITFGLWKVIDMQNIGNLQV